MSVMLTKMAGKALVFGFGFSVIGLGYWFWFLVCSWLVVLCSQFSVPGSQFPVPGVPVSRFRVFSSQFPVSRWFELPGSTCRFLGSRFPASVPIRSSRFPVPSFRFRFHFLVPGSRFLRRIALLAVPSLFPIPGVAFSVRSLMAVGAIGVIFAWRVSVPRPALMLLGSRQCRKLAAGNWQLAADSYACALSSLMISCSAAITSSRSTRDLVNRSWSLNAFVGAL